MLVWNVRCKNYRPGFVEVPAEEAKKLISKGDVQDPRVGALHLSKPEITVDDYQQKVVTAAPKTTAKKTKKKVTKKKATKKKKVTK